MARIAGVNIPTNKRVTIALRYIHGIGPAQGCGVEFLRYLQPASPGPMATDLQPEDALYTQILVRDPGLAQGCLLHDPDGHRLWLQP